jgi:hypothetical protein
MPISMLVSPPFSSAYLLLLSSCFSAASASSPTSVACSTSIGHATPPPALDPHWLYAAPPPLSRLEAICPSRPTDMRMKWEKTTFFSSVSCFQLLSAWFVDAAAKVVARLPV